jgi:hypothetical protein
MGEDSLIIVELLVSNDIQELRLLSDIIKAYWIAAVEKRHTELSSKTLNECLI